MSFSSHSVGGVDVESGSGLMVGDETLVAIFVDKGSMTTWFNCFTYIGEIEGHSSKRYVLDMRTIGTGDIVDPSPREGPCICFTLAIREHRLNCA